MLKQRRHFRIAIAHFKNLFPGNIRVKFLISFKVVWLRFRNVGKFSAAKTFQTTWNEYQ